MKIRRFAVAAVLAAAALTWQSPLSTADAQTEPGGTITVTPSTDLVDGQLVQVTGAGWTPQQGLTLAQCPTGVTTPTEAIQFCIAPTAVQVVPDDTGAFSASMEVSRPPCGTSPGVCSIYVLDLSALAVRSPVPISFGDGPTLAENITISPDTTVDHGEIVTVTGANFPPGVAVSVAQCLRFQDVTDENCDATPVTATTDATGAFTVDLTIERGLTIGAGFTVDCVDACLVAAFTADRAYLATTDIEMEEPWLLVTPSSSPTVTPEGTVHLSGTLHCSPSAGDVNLDGTLTQVVNDRTIAVPFRVATTCHRFEINRWEADVVSQRAARFRVGPATLTVRANETIDPHPDDDSLLTANVDLVRLVR